jgi:hypothetical protein
MQVLRELVLMGLADHHKRPRDKNTVNGKMASAEAHQMSRR